MRTGWILAVCLALVAFGLVDIFAASTLLDVLRGLASWSLAVMLIYASNGFDGGKS